MSSFFDVLCQVISILLGLFALLFFFPGLLPFLGSFQWLTLAVCTLGAIFGAFCRRKIGLTINIVIGVVAAIRLIHGGGIL